MTRSHNRVLAFPLFLVLVAAILASAIGQAQASTSTAPSVRTDAGITAEADYLSGRTLTVVCATSGSEWSRALSAVGLPAGEADEYYGFSLIPEGEMHLSPYVCEGLRLGEIASTRRSHELQVAWSVDVLVHESTHMARFTYDEELKSDSNPTGMVDCEVSVFVHSHGEWFEVSEKLRWEERAPIKEVWENNKPTGKFTLDRKKKNWWTMPETMMAKCVEAAVIRKAFPEETAGSYSEGELDQAEVLNLTATEIIEGEEQKRRFELIGGANCITIDWCDGEPLAREPVGVFGDKVLAFIAQHKSEDPDRVRMFHNRNAAALKEYWAKDKAGALELKKAFEAVQ